MNKKTGFSLIELSIVILIIGILIAGVTQSSVLVKKARLKTAQTLTNSSPVSSIKDLSLWYETSLESSFDNDEMENGTEISTWYDNNTQQTTKNNATQSTTANQPKFYENVFNSAIPGVRFDGSNDFMTFDGNFLINTNYTIFIVAQRRASPSSGTHFAMMGGTATITGQDLVLSYYGPTTIGQDHYDSSINYTISAYTTPTPDIHTFQFSSTAGKKYWYDGGTSTTGDANNATQTSAVTAYVGSALGRYDTSYLNGDIAEIIAYTRALKHEERQAIETYLSKKYNIEIN